MSYIKKINQLKIMVLEDMPSRIQFFKHKLHRHDVYFFDNADDAMNGLRYLNDKWDIVFLDHDLEGRIFVPSSYHNTGYTVAKFISENDIKINQIITHSMNPQGAQNIKAILSRAEIIPFNLLKTKL
mgnify:CR=1 FL=1